MKANVFAAVTTVLLAIAASALAQEIAVKSTSQSGAAKMPVDEQHSLPTYANGYGSRQSAESLAPRVAQRKAEFRATQRMGRLAALRWYGLSNARPTVSSTPWMGIYSPTWIANSRRPFGWTRAGQPMVVFCYSEP
jgi:hypothetical protein